MPTKSARERRAPSAQRRPATPARRVPAAGTSPAQQMQRRTGNQGAAAVLARAVQVRGERAVTQAAAASGIARASVNVSSPQDRAEREATSKATQVMGMSAPAPATPTTRTAQGVQRAASVSAPRTLATPSPLRGAAMGGQPLPGSVRSFMEPRFGADFASVRIHTDDQAASMSRGLSARAFTLGNHIYFGKGAYRPDNAEGRELIAHELTHTVQQGAAAPQVQRLGEDSILEFLADGANALPGYRMFTIVLGVNPIDMSQVDRSPANVLRAVVEFMPGGNLITRALDSYGVFERAGAFVDHQLQTLGLSARSIGNAIDVFVDSLDWSDALHPGEVWNGAVQIFSEPIDRVLRFLGSLAGAVVDMIKDAILRPLAALAQGTPAWDLLCAVLGQNPITGEAVERSPETLIGGFMKLIGQEEIWENIKRGNAVSRAWAWFQGALADVRRFVARIPGLFVETLTSLQIEDLVEVAGAFRRVAGIFGSFLRDFFAWAGTTIWNLLEIVFSVVAPGVMVYLRRAAGAFRTILQNPIAFLRNLISAGRLGFNQFLARFLTHLRTSLISWLTGTLGGAGVYIPQAFSLVEIVKFILSVLGLTWQNIRAKLVRAVGEPAVSALETGFDIVVTLVREGPAAAWQKIVESLSNLREMVIEQVMNFVRDRIVERAITSLLSLLSPVGAFIQAIIGIYNTVMFFVERLRQIATVAAAFIDSLSAIASGVLTQAANRVEQTLAGTLTLVISFLARIAGLGNVSQAITALLNRVRAPIDRALDRVVAWIVAQARRLGRFVAGAATGAVQTVAGWLGLRRSVRVGGETHTLFIRSRDGRRGVPMVASREVELQALIAPRGPLERQLEAANNSQGIAALGRIRSAYRDVVRASAVLAVDPSNRDANADLRRAFNEIGDQLPITGVSAQSEEALPQTQVSSAPRGPMAGSVTASPLSKRGSGGGRPTASIAGWAHVLRIDHGNWEKVHLVSQAFHGPGAFWNLIPARRSDNAWMRDGPEQFIKNLLERNAVVHYEVTVNSYHVLTDSTGARIDGFPESISLRLSTLRKDGTRWVRDVSLNPYPSKSFLPPSLISGQGVDLKTANDRGLRPLVPAGVASRVGAIKGPGAWSSEAEFKRRMQAHYLTLNPPVDFIATHWPLFARLIAQGRAFF